MPSSPLGTFRVPLRTGSTTVISGWYDVVIRVPGRKSSSSGPGWPGRGARQRSAGSASDPWCAPAASQTVTGSVSSCTFLENTGQPPKSGRFNQR